jgi:hypothetical protein
MLKTPALNFSIKALPPIYLFTGPLEGFLPATPFLSADVEDFLKEQLLKCIKTLRNYRNFPKTQVFIAVMNTLYVINYSIKIANLEWAKDVEYDSEELIKKY